MNILVTGANGQLGNEMRIISKQSEDKYIFTDVNQVEGLETTYLDITDLDAVRKMVAENDVKAIDEVPTQWNKLLDVLEKRQGLKVACLEGIAFRKGWISADKMRELAKPMLKNQYGQYLLQVVEEVERTGQANL